MLKWFDTRQAATVGAALADQVLSDTGPSKPRKANRDGLRPTIERFLQRVDQQARPLGLNLFQRAKLANTFKWSLLERGLEAAVADELTQLLLLRIGSAKHASVSPSVASQAVVPAAESPHSGAPAARPMGRRQVQQLLARALEFGQRGAHAEAAECFRQVTVADPRNFLAHDNLGVALYRLGRYGEAERHFRSAIGIKPNYAAAQFNLGTLLHTTADAAAAEAPLRRAVRLKPNYPDAHASLGLAYVLLARPKDAKSAFETALKYSPNHAAALCGLGQLARTEGRFQEAENWYKRALERDPGMAAAWGGLARLKKMTAADADWLARAEQLVSAGIEPAAESSLRFAMGKYCDDVGDYPRAFSHYRRGNELHKLTARPYDRAGRERFVEEMIAAYPRAALQSPAAGSCDSECPVFVVGMMRSGTSLLEQIIASHPAARGAGELPFWAQAIDTHGSALRRGKPDAALSGKLAAGYLKVLQAHAPEALRIVDKATFNSDFLGPIHSVFPRARIIHLRRDPIDSCLSCYFQQFPPALNFTCDLEDLAHYYREHHRLMAHWYSALPSGTILEVPYEALVSDQEPWTRRILEFIGLPFDERCLHFYQTERYVLTASAWQVRQKMYQGSIARWRRYEKHIGPLLELRSLAA